MRKVLAHSAVLGGTKGIAGALQSCRGWERGVPPSWASCGGAQRAAGSGWCFGEGTKQQLNVGTLLNVLVRRGMWLSRPFSCLHTPESLWV